GETLYAEAELSEEHAQEARRYAIHPALLDAALHAIALDEGGSAQLRLPFAWSGVSLSSHGPRQIRAQIKTQEGSASLQLFDPAGAPMAQVSSLALRAIDPAQLRAAQAKRRDSLLEIAWSPQELPEQGQGEDQAPKTETLRIEADPKLSGAK